MNVKLGKLDSIESQLIEVKLDVRDLKADVHEIKEEVVTLNKRSDKMEKNIAKNTLALCEMRLSDMRMV